MAEKLQLVRAHAGAWPAAVCMCGAGCMPRPPAATPQNAAPPHFRPASPAAGTAPPLSSWAATRAPPHLAGRWSNWRTCAISWPRRRRSCRQRCRPRTASWQRCSRPPPASAAAWPAAIPGPAQVGDRPERTARSAQMTAGPAQPASRGGGGRGRRPRARASIHSPAAGGAAAPLPPAPRRPVSLLTGRWWPARACRQREHAVQRAGRAAARSPHLLGAGGAALPGQGPATAAPPQHRPAARQVRPQRPSPMTQLYRRSAEP